MASLEDTDDLYADLYGAAEGGVGDVVDLGSEDKDTAKVEQDLIGYEDDDQKDVGGDSRDAGKSGDEAAAAPSTSSFIPPPSSAQQQQQHGGGMQIKGSFIPPPESSSQAHGDVRDLTPSSRNDASASAYDAGAGGYGGQQGAADANRNGNRELPPHEMPEEGKMFVGGLNWDTTEDSLRRHFSQFGEVGHCTVMRDANTGRSRGFAFLNFVDPKAVNTVMVREHYLDGKVIDPKRAIPRPQQSHHGLGGGFGAGQPAANQKLFVGGLPASVTPESFRTFFEQFGTLSECTCMMDRETGRPRGFGFLTYADDASLERILSTNPILFDGKEVDVKRAQSKNDPQSLQLRRQQRFDNPDGSMGTGMGPGMGGRMQQGNRFATGSNSYGGGNMGGNGWGMNPMMMGMMGQNAAGGFDPNAMAQMYQSMGWNPQMAWQQMMASMSQGGAGGAGGMDVNAMMGGMGAMGGMGNMSPPPANSMSPTLAAGSANGGNGRASSNGPSGPNGDDRHDRSDRGGQRGDSHTSGNGGGGSRAGLPSKPGYDSRDSRERSPARGGSRDDRSYRRERSPYRRDERRQDNGYRNRY
ncbi:related to HRP1 - subunit of cleavage factor I [Moesziomyces antarcticus]|uniref:Related to HRP1 - subunit of cleavage factor I n=1 Tax=Pseudozyma antarctica TaxID=84753 RepID=A0A5C3G0F8_PSEA2|nr:related to HRP1 - subunit of cleavage factor I [Moesziomyces antarcticus]SPO49339.1 related to HRP1 - subunit of cleavage factor I [Moesziomyces antarcticus]